MYIEKYSLWLDIKILFQTLTVFFRAGDSTQAFNQGQDFEFFTQSTDAPDENDKQ